MSVEEQLKIEIRFWEGEFPRACRQLATLRLYCRVLAILLLTALVVALFLKPLPAIGGILSLFVVILGMEASFHNCFIRSRQMAYALHKAKELIAVEASDYYIRQARTLLEEAIKSLHCVITLIRRPAQKAKATDGK